MSIVRVLVVSLVLMIFAGCDRSKTSHSRDNGHGGNHSHHHDEKTAQITVWSDRYEIFIEHPYVVTGTPADFVTHVTDLKTLEPRQKGSVTFLLQYQNEAPIEHTESAPARAGIYIPELKFPRRGEWIVKLRIPTDDKEALIELPPIMVYSSKQEADKAPEKETPQGITFLKEQQWKLKTKSESVSKRRMIKRLRVPAVVSAYPGLHVQVFSPVAGYLAFSTQPFSTIGQVVKKGDLLAFVRIPLSDFTIKVVEAEAQSIRAKLELEQAGLALTRAQKLAAEQIALAKSELDLSELTLTRVQKLTTEQVALAKLELEQAELTLARTQKLVAEKAKSEKELKEAEFAEKTARIKYETAQVKSEKELKEAEFAEKVARTNYKIAQVKSEKEIKEAEYSEKIAHASNDAAVALMDTYRKTGVVLVSDPRHGKLVCVELTSPIEGVITRIGAAIGEHISPERNIFTVLNTSLVLIEGKVLEVDVGKIASTKGAAYETPDAKGNFVSITEDKGRLIFTGLNVDPVSRTLPVIYELKNPNGQFRIGMSLTLYIETDHAEDALAVLESSIVDEEGKTVGFVQVAGETFQKRELTLGIRDSGFVQIVADPKQPALKEGERIVTQGPYAIRLASIASTVPAHGHHH